MIGFYHVQITKYSSDLVERMFGFMNGAKAYLEAANKYPEDDECHACKCFNADYAALLTSGLQGS